MFSEAVEIAWGPGAAVAAATHAAPGALADFPHSPRGVQNSFP